MEVLLHSDPLPQREHIKDSVKWTDRFPRRTAHFDHSPAFFEKCEFHFVYSLDFSLSTYSQRSSISYSYLRDGWPVWKKLVRAPFSTTQAPSSCFSVQAEQLGQRSFVLPEWGEDHCWSSWNMKLPGTSMENPGSFMDGGLQVSAYLGWIGRTQAASWMVGYKYLHTWDV